MTYKIEFITDSRFRGTKKKLQLMDKRLKKSGVKILNQGSIRELNFPAESYKGAKPSKSWRKLYVIERNKGQTWNDVMTKVNKIYAPKYKRI